MSLRICISLILGWLIMMSCTKTPTFREGIVEEGFVFDTAAFPSCHAATIAETPEGLICAFFGGTHERHPDVCIYVSRKVNGIWTPPGEVANGIVNDTLRYPTWNPVLYQVPGGDLMLFYKVGPSPSTWQGRYIISTDAGKSWGAVNRLPDGYIGPVKNKPVLLKDGTLLCPSSTEGDGWKVHLEKTPDHGKTWRSTGALNNPKVYNVIQPTLLIYSDERLQLLCRSTNAVIAESWSEDHGKTWSLFQASPLPNNNSGIDGVSLKDGRQLLVYNHTKTPQGAKKGHRTPLNVAVSEDGKSWYASLILEDSGIGQYSYPSVIQSADGFVHIVYTWRREKIKYVKVDPSMLKTVKIIDEKWPGKN